MLECSNVSKFYSSRQALDGVSFKIARGETTGILGGGSSGKSTVLRVLSGYLAPTNGWVAVEGADPLRSAAVRRKIGYLPETTPLPPTMRVGEYLRFRAGLKGIPGGSETRKAIDAAFGTTPAAVVEDELLNRLRSNERQWVGIADCLLGQPEILLLDEFTSGMDAQNAELARELVRTCTGKATVVVTGRVLEEMERMCHRAVVLEQGRVLADGDLKTIARNNVDERTIVMGIVSAEPVREALRAVPGVRTVSVTQEDTEGGIKGEKTVRITVPPGVDLRQEFSQICAKRGWLITGMRLEPVRLGDITRKLTAARV